MADQVTLDYDRASRKGMIRVRLRDGAGAVLHSDTVEVDSHEKRQQFIKRMRDAVPGLAAAEHEVHRQLVEISGKLADSEAKSADGAVAAEVTQIVRPELFITEDVIGLTVPESIITTGELRGRWQMCLYWSDDRREVRSLERAVDLPDGGRLWLNPHPADPSPNMQSGWSSRARRAWLEGAEHPDPVAVFLRMCEAFDYYIELPADRGPGTVATAALWTMLSYVYPAWQAVPYFYVGGPADSGKSTLFAVWRRLVYRPLNTSNTTAAAMFRTLHERGGVLLLDEAERLKESTPDAAELRSILLAGYKSGGTATRLEAVGDTFRPVEFDVYGPKAMACIAGLPAALASRCIPVTMFRAPPGSEKPKRRLDEHPERWTALRDDLHALALGPMGRAATRLARRADVCSQSARDYELWQPILALAAWLEDQGAVGLLSIVQDHAHYTVETHRDNKTPDTDELLLRLLAEAVMDLEAPTPADLLKQAREAEPELFQRWGPRGVSNVLAKYGIKTKHRRQRQYTDVTVPMLLRIQRSYGMDLGIPDTPAGAAPLASAAPSGRGGAATMATIAAQATKEKGVA